MKIDSFVEYLIYDVFDKSLNVTSRAMMGGNVLYSNGKVFAIAENDELWFKGSNDLAEWYLSRGSKKFSYEKKDKSGKKNIQDMNFFFVPESVIENKEELNEWLDIALSVAKLPKKKSKPLYVDISLR